MGNMINAVVLFIIMVFVATMMVFLGAAVDTLKSIEWELESIRLQNRTTVERLTEIEKYITE